MVNDHRGTDGVYISVNRAPEDTLHNNLIRMSMFLLAARLDVFLLTHPA